MKTWQNNQVQAEELEDWPKVVIIILNWNGWKDTIECLESVFRIDYPNYQVIVIDNGSTDDSIERIKAWAEGKQKVLTPESTHPLYNLSHPPVSKPIPYIEYDRESAETGGLPEKEKLLYDSLLGSIPHPLILIQTGANLGFARGNNVGIRYALMNNYDYVMLLNNDTVVSQKSFLEEMINFMEENKEVGVSVPCIYYYDQPDKIWNCGGILFLGWRKYYNSKGIAKKNSGSLKISYATGCALLVRREMLEKFGLLSEDFFFGEEDYEFSMRMKKNKVKMVCVLNTKIYHKVSTSINKLSQTKIKLAFIHHLNRVVHLKRYYPKILWKLYRVFALSYIFLMLKVRYNISSKEAFHYIMKLIKISDRLSKVDKQTFDNILGGDL